MLDFFKRNLLMMLTSKKILLNLSIDGKRSLSKIYNFFIERKDYKYKNIFIFDFYEFITELYYNHIIEEI